MMLYLLDTDVVSNLRKRNPSQELLSWLNGTPPEQVRIPLVVIFEIQRGIETLRQDGKQSLAAEIEAWLERLLDASGADGLISPGVDDVRLQARMFSAPALRNFLLPGPRSSKPKFGGDIIIAAMAITSQAAIVSFNVDDYLQINTHFPLVGGLFHPGRNEWSIKPTSLTGQVGLC